MNLVTVEQSQTTWPSAKTAALEAAPCISVVPVRHPPRQLSNHPSLRVALDRFVLVRHVAQELHQALEGLSGCVCHGIVALKEGNPGKHAHLNDRVLALGPLYGGHAAQQRVLRHRAHAAGKVPKVSSACALRPNPA